MGCFSYDLKYRHLNILIFQAQQNTCNDSPEMGELLRRFDPLARKIGSQLTADPYLRDDAANSARLAFVQAVRRHDLNRAGFPTYAASFMRGAALRSLMGTHRRGAGNKVTLLTTDFTSETSETLVPGVVPEEDVGLWGGGRVAAAVSTLSPSQQDLLRRRYVEDQDLSHIGDQTTGTASAVRQRLRTAHRAIIRHMAA